MISLPLPLSLNFPSRNLSSFLTASLAQILPTFPQGLALIHHFLFHPQPNCHPGSFQPKEPSFHPSIHGDVSIYFLLAYQNLKMMPVATRTMMMEMVIVT